MIKELQETEGENFDSSKVYKKLMANKDVGRIVDQFLDDFLENDDALPYSGDLVFKDSFNNSPDLHRVLTMEEKSRFSPEAHGFLIRLFKLKLIDIDVQEELIERSIEVSPHVVPLSVIKGITFYTLSMKMPELFFRGMSRYFENDEISYH